MSKYPRYEQLLSEHDHYSQPMICLEFLMGHEKTSAFELREKFGFLDPAKQISILKKVYGITIYRKTKAVVNRFGRKVRTKEYSLEPLEGFTEEMNGKA